VIPLETLQNFGKPNRRHRSVQLFSAAVPKRASQAQRAWPIAPEQTFDAFFLSSHLACFHLITRSARASTFGGIVRPICLAALRLTRNSNFFGCSTGKSAGLAPLRILST